MGDAASKNAPRRSGAELLELELDRLRRAASGSGLVGRPDGAEDEQEPEEAPSPAPRVPLWSWAVIVAALLFGFLLVRLVSWLFDFPTDTLDARSGAPMSAREYQLLLISLAIGVTAVVLADVVAAIRIALGGRMSGARQALGCCGIVAAALAVYPWEAAVWLSEGAQERHTVRDIAAVLLAGAAVFWLYPRASLLVQTLVAAVVVWELVAPYQLGWVEEPTTAWLGPDPASGIALLRYAVLVPVFFTILAAGALVARGQGPRRGWHEVLGVLAFGLGALLLMPWPRLLWADQPPQQHQLIGWMLAGTLIVAQGMLLLAPSGYAGTFTSDPGTDEQG